MAITIEFGLPNGAGGLAAGYSSQYLQRALREWSEHRCCEISIGSRSHSHRRWLTVTFSRAEDLTVFALTWNRRSFMQWRIADQNGSAE